MNNFLTYLELGLLHISDLGAYDHMLFLVALCAVFKPSQWKKVVWLVTAFTVGHALSLVLSVLEIVQFPSNLVEALIPITILITAIFNLIQAFEAKVSSDMGLQYLMALVFGLVHGMGFANYFMSFMQFKGGELFVPLLAFNVGIELGQVAIVLFILLLNYAVVRLLNTQQKWWAIAVLIAVILLTLPLIWATIDIYR